MIVNKLLLISLCLILVSCAGCSGNKPTTSGLHNGKFYKCPKTPNCINSQTLSTSTEFVAPMKYNKNASLNQIMDLLIKTIRAFPKASIVEQKKNYLLIEFKTFIGFVDDVELFIDDDFNVVHIRSASRLGYYDFNKNKSRYQELYKALSRSSLFKMI